MSVELESDLLPPRDGARDVAESVPARPHTGFISAGTGDKTDKHLLISHKEYTMAMADKNPGERRASSDVK